MTCTIHSSSSSSSSSTEPCEFHQHLFFSLPYSSQTRWTRTTSPSLLVISFPSSTGPIVIPTYHRSISPDLTWTLLHTIRRSHRSTMIGRRPNFQSVMTAPKSDPAHPRAHLERAQVQGVSSWATTSFFYGPTCSPRKLSRNEQTT